MRRTTSEINSEAIRVYWFILRYWVREGAPPTAREIWEWSEFSSLNTVLRYVNILKEWGWITKKESRADRFIHFTRPSEIGLSREQVAKLLDEYDAA